MKLGKIQSNVSFKRALTSTEMSEYTDVLSKARDTINRGGKSILIVHDSCLPQAASTDTGVGHLTSATAKDYFNYVKNYFGINTVEVLPQGEIQLKRTPNFYNTYNGSGLSLGAQEIDLELLTDSTKGTPILSKEDFQAVVDANKKTAQEGLANYENVLGPESAQEKALRRAFDNFRDNPSIDKSDFVQFKKANADWLEKKAVYEVLKKENKGKVWTEWEKEIDKILFDDLSNKKAQKRLAQIKANKKNAKEIDYQMFKQFLADKHLQLGRKNLNDNGMKLFGDCLIGFSQDEIWGNKKAFMTGVGVGEKDWNLPALNYENILKPDSEAQKLLKRKVELFAQRYDGIRFDCSWCYVEPKLSNGKKYKFDGKILDIIEDTVKKAKEAKGEKFVLTDLIHEFEAGPEDFAIFDPAKRIKPFLKDRVKVISSAHLNNEYGSAAIMQKLGVEPDGYVIGVGNHDPQPLRQIAQNIPEELNGKLSYRRRGQAEILSQILNINPNEMTTAAEFSKAKFAEPMTAKNQMIFYMDLAGRKERFDSQSLNNWRNYRFRIPEEFAKQQEQVLQEGFGFNPMDAYAKAFKAKGLDKTETSLYRKILKFRDILSEKTEAIAKTVKTKSKDLSKNKAFNIGAVILALGLVGIVVSSAKNSLEKVK